jgi:hypothetical protein
VSTVRPAAEVNDGNGAPVAGGGEEEVEELQGGVEKLGVEALVGESVWCTRGPIGGW